MYSMWLSTEQQRVWRNYLEMGAALQVEMNRQLQRDCGLSLADYDVLVALEERDVCRVHELGERLAWEQSRLSHQLRRMRTRGLVARRGADDDRRGATVELTDAGRTALEAAAAGHVALVREVVFAGMRSGDLAALDRWTSSVLERLRGRRNPSA
ncbi:MarR family winged helix-turn-helix transcriptional regulator [Mycolicibacterium sp.]|uniref:MarR family winged helix-turn-helix transcriptional regulator n=1 Tax=Mycolicibacterium sp. TaxID=2320850 RepID=UPI001A1EBF6B|nr:MarR family winged helix-turn-helix transcriptional regulator [Mycolicibacterium sp.]MBJ7339376.1 winged helix-turn-helix transcriptional regulator [Mycolicibacterium sp.]